MRRVHTKLLFKLCFIVYKVNLNLIFKLTYQPKIYIPIKNDNVKLYFIKNKNRY